MKIKSKVTKVGVPTPAAADAAAAKVTPKVKGKAKDKTAPKVVESSKYKGLTTGMRVMDYQDSTFIAQPTAMLTDEELAANWHAEFPHAVFFTTGHVSGARRDYNLGKHAKSTPTPKTPIGAVVIVNGKRVWASAIKAVDAPKAAVPAPKAKVVKPVKPVAAAPEKIVPAKVVKPVATVKPERLKKAS